MTANGKLSFGLRLPEQVRPAVPEYFHERCFTNIPCGKTEIIGAEPDRAVMTDMDMMQWQLTTGSVFFQRMTVRSKTNRNRIILSFQFVQPCRQPVLEPQIFFPLPCRQFRIVAMENFFAVLIPGL